MLASADSKQAHYSLPQLERANYVFFSQFVRAKLAKGCEWPQASEVTHISQSRTSVWNRSTSRTRAPHQAQTDHTAQHGR
jgi:hypothetical protein